MFAQAEDVLDQDVRDVLAAAVFLHHPELADVAERLRGGTPMLAATKAPATGT